jgi:Ca-activated chloride channel family protein
MIASKQAGEDGFFLLTLTAGEELAKPDGEGADYVFILDISGSMSSDGKLALSRNSLNAFVERLGKDDRFELIAFNVKPHTLFGKLESVEDATKDRAGDFLASQQARGGTVLHPAINAAYRYGDPDRTLNVVILSDGMTEQQERRELIELIGQRPSHARVFCIGVGNEVNRPLLEQLAQQAGGLAAFISRGADFDRQAQAFLRKLTHPVATDLTITFDDSGIYDVEPPTLGNLYHGVPLTVFGRYRAGGTVKVKVTGNIRGRAITTTAELAFPTKESANSEIERMWAWQRIDRLLKQADRRGSRDQVVDEVVRLGEAFSIASEYTSFIVLENDGEYQRWKIKQRNALRIERDRAGRNAVQEQLAELRRKATDGLGPMQSPSAQSTADSAVTPDRQANAANPTRVASRRTTPGRSFNLPTGGAIDPLSAALALGLAGLTIVARRKRNPRR